MSEIRSFRDLEVWQYCQKTRIAVWELCKKFPSEEKYRLSDQIIRASRSATANIAEGYGRFNFQENIQHCRIARGSLHEVSDHLSVALECGFISTESYEQMDSLLQSGIRLQNGYINFLVNSKKSQ